MKEEVFTFNGTMFPKAMIKDGWGSEFFMVRGEAPPWLMECNVPVLERTIHGKDPEDVEFDWFIEQYDDKWVSARPKLFVAYTDNDEVVSVIKLKEVLIRLPIHELFSELFGEKLRYKAGDGKVIAEQDKKVVAIVAGLSPKLLKIMPAKDYLEGRIQSDGPGISGSGEGQQDDNQCGSGEPPGDD